MKPTKDTLHLGTQNCWYIVLWIESHRKTYINIIICCKHSGDVASYYCILANGHSDKGVLELWGKQIPPDNDVHGGSGC